MAQEFGSKIFCYVRYTTKEGKRPDLMAAINEKKIQERYQSQPGNIEYSFYAPTNDENALYLVDIWEDQATFDAHLDTDVKPDFLAMKEAYVEKTELVFQFGGK
ncbi:MAG: antibiotic biosynthesis monooxygenase [Firmicutes bacterium]|nr:antibiotic biosynthesis monooxygenase [Bacillota bacterium]